MTRNSTLNQKIHSQFSYSTSDNIALKIEKIRRYFQDTQNNIPLINLQNQGKNLIKDIFKSLFDSQNGMLLIETQFPYKNYLEDQSFQSQTQAVFQEFMKFIQNEERRNGVNLISFLQFWLQRKPNVGVFNEKYYDQIFGVVQSQLTSIYKKVSQNLSQKIQAINLGKQEDCKKKGSQQQFNKKEKFTLKFQIQKEDLIDKTKQKIQKNKNPLASKQSSYYSTYSNKVSNLQQKDPFNYYLRKFYDHYCKKYLNTIKGQQFEKLQQFYNSMNLTKFMQYCKDIKLLNLQNKLSAQNLQPLFKSQQNIKRCLEYESFAKIIKKCLQDIFETKQMIESKGFQLIGVLNRQNFVEVMGKVGVIVPLKKTVMVKPQLISKEYTLRKSRSKNTFHLKQSLMMKQSTLKNYSTINGHGHESHWDSNDLHPDIFLHEKERKQQRLLQCLSIPKLNKLQPSKFMDEKLQQFIDQQYDPYLKRYNQKSVHKNSNGVLKRMDQRINNYVKKIR